MTKVELKAEIVEIAKEFNLPKKAVKCIKEDDYEHIKCMDKTELWVCSYIMKDFAEWVLNP